MFRTALQVFIPNRLSRRSLHSAVQSINQHVVDVFRERDGGCVFDLTCGDGKMTRALLEQNIPVLALDRDAKAVNNLLLTTDLDQCSVHHGRFSDLPNIIKENKTVLYPWVQRCSGILLDFGVSDLQANSCRGFHPHLDEPLDLRMDENGTTAAELLNYLDMESLIKILKVYGGVTSSKAIVTDIIERRYLRKPIHSSADLRNLVIGALEQTQSDQFKGENRDELVRHNTSQVFLALRMFVNNELNEMKFVLQLAKKILKPGGKLAVLLRSSKEEDHLRNFLNGGTRLEVKGSDWRLETIHKWTDPSCTLLQAERL